MNLNNSGLELQRGKKKNNFHLTNTSPDEKQIALIAHDAHGAIHLKLLVTETSDLREIKTVESFTKDTALSEVREIEWKTSDYPVKMRGLFQNSL